MHRCLAILNCFKWKGNRLRKIRIDSTQHRLHSQDPLWGLGLHMQTDIIKKIQKIWFFKINRI